jgi:hypothetical protein
MNDNLLNQTLLRRVKGPFILFAESSWKEDGATALHPSGPNSPSISNLSKNRSNLSNY